MNNILNLLNLVAESILEKFVPKGIASAGCYKYKTTWDLSCLRCTPFPQGKKKINQRRWCDTPYPYTCANTPHCSGWETISTECFQC